MTSVAAQTQADTLLKQQVNMVVAIIRGFDQGFTRGVYQLNTYKIDDQCLAQNTGDAIFQIYNDVRDGKVDEAWNDIVAAYNIFYYTDNKCNLKDLLWDIVQFCDYNDCTSQTILNNMLAKVFVMTGNINSIAQIIYQTQPALVDLNAYTELYTTVGTNVGQMFQSIFDFKPILK